MPVTASDRSAQHNGSEASHRSADPANGSADPANGSADPANGSNSSQVLTYPGTNGVLAAVRADVARWFADRGFSADTVERAVLVVSELCSNAVEAGPGHPIDVRLTPTAGPPRPRAVIAVTNTTLGDIPPPREQWAPADPLAPRGRGLAIVDALADQVRVDSSVAGRITVVAHISA